MSRKVLHHLLCMAPAQTLPQAITRATLMAPETVLVSLPFLHLTLEPEILHWSCGSIIKPHLHIRVTITGVHLVVLTLEEQIQIL